MVKIDKHQYTKEEWHRIRDARRREKAIKRGLKPPPEKNDPHANTKRSKHQAFVLGNGTSRADIIPDELIVHGKIYGCNALYRTFVPDYLVAVDVKMVLEINKAKFQHKHTVWTNPNKAFQSMKGLNFSLGFTMTSFKGRDKQSDDTSSGPSPVPETSLPDNQKQ